MKSCGVGIYGHSRETYGRLRSMPSSRPVGTRWAVSVMREDGLSGVSRRRSRQKTYPEPGRPACGVGLCPAPVPCQCPGSAVRVADVMYLPIWLGFVFLAVVFDVLSRSIEGGSMAGHLRAQLALFNFIDGWRRTGLGRSTLGYLGPSDLGRAVARQRLAVARSRSHKPKPGTTHRGVFCPPA